MTSPNDADSPSEGDRDRDMQKFIDELLMPYARRVSSGKQGRVDLQPESLIVSVITDHLDEARLASAGSQDAANKLRAAVKFKFLDRLRKGGKAGQPMQFSQSDGTGPDPADNQSTPLSIIEDADTLQGDKQRQAFFHETIFSACSDDADRAIIQGYLLDGLGWADVAALAKLNEAAARKRLSRLRTEVLRRLIDAVRSELSAESWAVAEGAIINRQPIAMLAAALGQTEPQIDRIMMAVVTDCLADRYGAAAIEPIGRLLPRRKH